MQPERPRESKHLAGQVKAIATRADELLGRKENFDQKTFAYFGLTVPATALRDTEQDRREIDGLLPGTGSLPAALCRIRRKFLVPADRFPAVMARADARLPGSDTAASAIAGRRTVQRRIRA